MSVSTYVVGQFRRPHGAVGRLAGWVMASRPSNRRRNDWTLELLEIEPGHRVLEIGFGPGYGIEQLVKRNPGVHVLGIDHSPAMLAQASHRNREAIRRGQVELRCASLDSLGSLPGKFDRIWSSNVAQFWNDRVAVFRSIRGLLGPGGRVATTYLPRHRGATDQDAIRFGESLVRDMRAAGFADARLETGPRVPLQTVSAVGEVSR